jgi:hypothetical protein
MARYRVSHSEDGVELKERGWYIYCFLSWRPMKKKKRNCWEIKRCGRELGGEEAYLLGVCPAATEIRLDGVHGGENAGRACWAVEGTMCYGRLQGHFIEKFKECAECEVYEVIKQEEDGNLQRTIVLLDSNER